MLQLNTLLNLCEKFVLFSLKKGEKYIFTPKYSWLYHLLLMASKGCVFHTKVFCKCLQKVDPGVFFSFVFTMGQLAANTKEIERKYNDPQTATW